MIAHNKFAKAISRQPSPQNLFYSKLLKNLKNSVFTTFFQLYFLANEITTVHRSGTFFIEYVFEFISSEAIIPTYFEIQVFERH